MTVLIEIIVFLLGFLLVVYTLNAAVRTFVLPRGENVFLTRVVFASLKALFDFRAGLSRSEKSAENILALFPPTALLFLPFVWLTFVLVGFMGMFWAVGVRPLERAFLLSGSSLLTLGFSPVSNLTETILAFFDAAIGLGLIALLIAYLPAIYAAFSQRETLVAKLEVYAGIPPSPIEIIARMHRIEGIAYLKELYTLWETWFAEIEETQTTFAVLNFFRSPQPHRSWITAAGAILDSAALVLSTLDIPREPRAALCIRSGYLALRSIADFFYFEYDHDPQYGDPISVTREEFDAACAQLEAQGLALKPDWNQAYRDFAGWRINYDAVLLAIAAITKAPPALWTSDRAKLLPVRRKK